VKTSQDSEDVMSVALATFTFGCVFLVFALVVIAADEDHSGWFNRIAASIAFVCVVVSFTITAAELFI
jgi:dipeptide/tripeptide permease